MSAGLPAGAGRGLDVHGQVEAIDVALPDDVLVAV